MRAAMQDMNIFRSSGHEDEMHQIQISSALSSRTPPHRAIFRRPKQSYSPSRSASSDEAIMVPLHRGPSWPPLTIPESESADTSKLIGRSRPIQSGSSLSRHMELSASASSDREHQKTPLYYKIQMHNGRANLASGDDSSVMITDEHNDRIQLTPIRTRKHRLNRASNITEASSFSSGSPARNGSNHHQTWEEEKKWEVMENGQIVATTTTPSSLSSRNQSRIKTSTPNAPKKSFLYSMRTQNVPQKARKSNRSESPPRLEKSSFDTVSTDASSTDNSLCNEMLDFAEPNSPPRMDRMLCPAQVLFSDSSNESKKSKSSRSSRSKRSSKSGSSKDFENSMDESNNTGFISRLIEYISIGPCCHMDSMCRGRDQTVS